MRTKPARRAVRPGPGQVVQAGPANAHAALDAPDDSDGSDGPDESDGSDGTDDSDGSDGPDDSDGSDGPDDSDGSDGPDRLCK